MQEDLLGELSFSGGRVEIRQYAWQEPELLTFRRESYMLSRLLTRTDGHRPFGWRLPRAQHTVSPAQMSVVAPQTPVDVSFDKGEAIIVSCILTPAYFERATGIADWSDEHTFLCLGLRSPLIGLIFNRLAHEVNFLRSDSRNVAEAFVGALTAEVVRGLERSMGERPNGQFAPWKLQQIYNLVEGDGHAGRLTIEQIAHRCGLSSRHLMRGFKASTGLTLHQYNSEVRMRRALAMLKTDDLPIKTVAAKLGFNSPSSFTAAFRRQAGCTPSQFRDRMQQA